ncbi:type II toxin-antitoxin system death-on-curing family toxin [Haloactinopolyspora sp.]|uniref:type II toxin-antitoxin system death-on-curing family toxin n=1 Tax=Haloactinopolyspora sp. TaxID=1966353 RepID=UPI00261A5B52|nr:type II toxin-antitoxin system death-on-curing family toxin [Haloactinopolyspora sp.]
MTVFLDLEDLFDVAMIVLGREPEVRDLGLLDSAVHRPRSSMFGTEAYPDLLSKAAALLESLGRNHGLVDGNKRLAWAAVAVFLLDNGRSILDVDQDEAYDFVISVASGELELADMAAWLAANVAALE